jgi:hypothetical protein
MPEQKEPPRPHGDPLEEEAMNTGEAAGREVDSGKRDRANLDRGPSTGSGPTRAVSRGGSLDEPNPAQRQSDATTDAASLPGVEEPTIGTASDANGIPASDEAAGAERRKRYDDGAELVSRID